MGAQRGLSLRELLLILVMAIVITHSAVATGADDPSKEINKAQWNDAHVVQGAAEQTSLDAVSAAVDVVIAAIATETANREAADDALSQAISVVSHALSVLSQAASVADAALSLRADAVSQAVSIVSNAVSVLSQATSVANAALSVRVNTVSDAVSVLSQQNSVEHAALSARITSVAGQPGGAASVTSNELSAAAADLSTKVNTVSDAVSNEISVRAAASAALQGNINTVSNALSNEISNRASAVSTVSHAVSVLSQQNSVEHAALSARITSVAGAAAASVTSDEASAISQQASVNLNTRAPWPRVQYATISNTQSINVSTLTDISGMVLTVAANETWKVEGALLVSTSAGGGGIRIGCSVPPLSTPRFIVFDTASALQQSAVAPTGGGQMQVSGASLFLSITSAVDGGVVPVRFDGLFNVASAGTFRLMAAGIASTAASPLHVVGGYYIAYRLK